MRRVVVTGIGISSPIGTGRDEFWSSLTAGMSGIGPLTLFDASALPVHIGGEVSGLDVDKVRQQIPEVAMVRDRKVLLGFAAAEEAMNDAGLSSGKLDGIIEVGVGLEVLFLKNVVDAWHAGGRKKQLVGKVVSDLEEYLQTPLNLLAVLLAKRYGFMGPIYTNCSACAAGAQAIGHAFQLIREGVCTIALAGGADSMLNPLGVGGFSLLGALSTENDCPARACRPFDATRQGTVLGEGAAFVVLEELSTARGRGVSVHTEVLGYGSSLDAHSVSDPPPDGKGAVLAMKKALDDAGIEPEDVDHINSHGTGTPKNDIAETLAIKTVFGNRSYEIPITAVKSMTGHMIGASGAVEFVASVLTLLTAVIPPTINLTTPDPGCDLDYVPEGARKFRGSTVLSSSFGFGGQNAAIVLRRLHN